MIPNTLEEGSSARRLRHQPDLTPHRSRVKRRKIAQESAPQNHTQQIARINLVTQHDEISKNVVWLNPEDYIALFTAIPANTADQIQQKHIQISNRVYQVAIKNWLPTGNIGLTPRQFEDVKKRGGVSVYEGSDSIVISAFTPTRREFNDLQSVTFEIEPNEELGQFSSVSKTLDLFELRAAFREKLRNKFVANEQVFYIENALGRFKAVIKNMVSTPMAQRVAEEDDRLVSPFGHIDNATLFEFQLKGHPEIAIVNQEVLAQDAKLNFTLSLADSLDKMAKNNLPLKIDYDILSSEATKILRGKSLIMGQKYPLKFDNFGLQLKFDKIVHADSEKIAESPSKKYETAYKYTNNAKLEIAPAKDIILTKGEPVLAGQAEFEITSITDPSAPETSLLWINTDVIKNAIKQLSPGVVKGQRFQLKFPQIKLWVQLKNARRAEPYVTINKQKKCWKKQWVLDPNTDINITRAYNIKWALIDTNTPVDITQVTIRIDKAGRNITTIQEKDLDEAARKYLAEGVVIDQTFFADVKGQKIEFLISDLEYDEKDKPNIKYGVLGKVLPATRFKFINESEDMAITSKSNTADPVLKLEEMGFGGLSEHGKKIIRKVVNERRSPMKEEMEKRGLQPSKGLLLYGPPGTGKTLLARCLGSILGCDEEHVQMLSGTKVYSKWVGESEQRVRELFAPALEAARKFKKDSEVFLVIIDEIDGILSQRAGDHNKWRDTVVNEFLAQMDGLEQFDNILIVGMTNRLKELDEAVVRSGRFGDKVEISIPDAKGRRQILEIHTRELRKKNLLHENVDLDAISLKLQGFTGADIRGLVKTAADYALDRLSQLAYKGESLADRTEALTTNKDFEMAIAEMVKSEPMSDSVKMMYI